MAEPGKLSAAGRGPRAFYGPEHLISVPFEGMRTWLRVRARSKHLPQVAVVSRDQDEGDRHSPEDAEWILVAEGGSHGHFEKRNIRAPSIMSIAETSFTKLSLSLRKNTPISSANTMLVSRSAVTAAMGACVNAHTTSA